MSFTQGPSNFAWCFALKKQVLLKQCILLCTKFQFTCYIQKQSLYKPSRFQEDEDPRFQDNQHEGGKDISPTQTPPLSPRKSLLFISVEG